ncbi:glycosyltransferase family 2 protein [Allokutzneria multivorans]|uniref:4,4'-diaponeurosporenoate glycosyltransferase n=1 Tax=Allokutzneria multivorans TaxID=1142134 RepID=A0ABP7TT70_9PSEU
MPRSTRESGRPLRRAATFVAAASVLRTAYTLVNLRRQRPIAAEPLREQPTVSVIVPARDEAATIDACLTALRAQTHTALRILVVDDGSTDDTAAIVDRHAEEDPRVRVVESDGPPDGWAGKVHAMHVGVIAADSAPDWPDASGPTDWLLFFDADTTAHPELIGRLLTTALAREADLVSTPGVTDRTRLEHWTVMPSAVAMILESAGPDGRGLLALAYGHCMLFRRDAYEQIGGWPAVAGSRGEDVAMATLLRDQGARTLCVDSQGLFGNSGFDGFGVMWRSLRKSFVAGNNGDVRVLGAGAASQGLFSIVPVLALTKGLRRRNKRLIAMGAVAWGAQAVSHGAVARTLNQPAATGVVGPLAGVAFAALLGDAVRVTMGKSTTWRGRPVVAKGGEPLLRVGRRHTNL